MNLANVTKDSFKTEVLDADNLVVVDFWATWCVPCKMVEPVLEQLAGDHEQDLKVVRVNVDEQGELAAQYNIVSIPAMLFFKNGEMVDQQVGAVPQNTLEEKVKAHL